MVECRQLISKRLDTEECGEILNSHYDTNISARKQFSVRQSHGFLHKSLGTKHFHIRRFILNELGRSNKVWLKSHFKLTSSDFQNALS